MLNVSGNIPEKITLLVRPSTKVRPKWDDFEEDNAQEIEVKPAFVADSSNPKTIETGRQWASSPQIFDSVSKRWTKQTMTEEISLDNSPTEGYRIVCLEKRDEGGRAYKVVSPFNHYFDLREDVLLDTMLKVGVDAGGKLNGSYVWARVGSQMKLVRVGSELHDALVKASIRGKSSNITKPISCHIYRNRKGEYWVFCGLVNTWTAESIKPKFIKNMQLWIKLDNYLIKDSPLQAFHMQLSESRYWGYNVKKSCTVVEDIGEVDMSSDEIIKKVREVMEQINSKRIKEQINWDSSLYHMDLECISPNNTSWPVPDRYRNLVANL